MLNSVLRDKIIQEIDEQRPYIIELCSQLIKSESVTPPSDTREIANIVADILRQVEGAEVTLHIKEDPVVNVVARIKGNGPGERLVFNGHLDTFPVGDRDDWTVDPFSADIKDGYLYGRGVSDMKGGVACSILAFMIMAEHRDSWAGELVLVLVGDEENGGERGTKYLIETIPHAMGDAMINGDVGTPGILRFGEKGMLWLELHAVGKSAHGAHVHKGENAIDILTEGMTRIEQSLKRIEVNTPKEVTEAIEKAGSISEQYAGEGETDVLQSITVNFGMANGGTSPNLVPADASAKIDIRLPVGITIETVEQTVREIIDSIQGLSYKVLQSYGTNWSDVNHKMFTQAMANARQVTGSTPALTMRVGASDARFYRSKGIPSINCGLTPHNLGGPDESVEVKELVDVTKIHALTALDYLGVPVTTRNLSNNIRE